MLTKFRFYFLGFFAASLLLSCGDDGEQGLSAALKRGSFSGTISGTRQDGTAFSEPFTYEYTYNTVESFFLNNGVQEISINRVLSPADGERAYLTLGLKSETGDALTKSSNYSSSVSFYKTLDADKVFSLYAYATNTVTAAFTRELSPEQNDTYKFSTTGYDRISYFTGTISGVSSYRFSTSAGYTVYYSQATGALVAVLENSTQATLTSGAAFDLYKKLTFKLNATVGIRVFHDAATGASLHQAVAEIPADEVTITNYSRASGVVTFDFTMKINGNRENTTRHDLTVTGKFNSGDKVYKEVVYGSQN